MDMFYGNSIQDHKIKAQLQSTKYVFCVCFQGTLAETILQPLLFLHVVIAVAQLWQNCFHGSFMHKVLHGLWH